MSTFWISHLAYMYILAVIVRSVGRLKSQTRKRLHPKCTENEIHNIYSVACCICSQLYKYYSQITEGSHRPRSFEPITVWGGVGVSFTFDYIIN